MKKLLYIMWSGIMFPFDLFRFTIDAWRYTHGWYQYRIRCHHKDQPCIFCRGMDLGAVPRRMGMRIKYRNLWLVNFLQPELKFQKAEDRIRPRIACMREGGFVRVPGYIPLCAVVLSFFWIGVLLVGVWVFNVIPDEVQEQILANIGRTASS